MWRFVFRLGATIAIGIMPAMALSHAFLSQAVPLVGGTVPVPPKEIRLTFTEALEPHFSGIELTTAEGQGIASGPAIVDPANDKQLVLPLPPLAPGTYRVHWHVVSVDTHRTEGEYNFTVAR
jgi:methionine-rich copper-binding protein CopC